MRISELRTAELTGRGLLPCQAEAFVAAIGKLDQRMTAGQVWQWITRNLLRPEHPLEVHEYLHGAVFVDWDPASGPAPAWFPDDPDASNIAWLMRQAGTASYRDLHAWSVAQPQAFWATMVERLDVQFRNPFVSAVDLADGPEHPRWLVGARLNVVDSCFQASDNSPAVIYQAENGPLESLSAADLRSLVARVGQHLGGHEFAITTYHVSPCCDFRFFPKGAKHDSPGQRPGFWKPKLRSPERAQHEGLRNAGTWADHPL
jgi:acetyl-CoA synthetase